MVKEEVEKVKQFPISLHYLPSFHGLRVMEPRSVKKESLDGWIMHPPHHIFLLVPHPGVATHTRLEVKGTFEAEALRLYTVYAMDVGWGSTVSQFHTTQE